MPESSFHPVAVNALMRSAPSVNCPVGRSRFAGYLALALWCGGMLLALRTGALADAFDWRQGLLVVLVLASGAVAAASWWFAAQGSLRWDGRRWLWSDSSTAIERVGGLSVALDLQQRMLLRFRADDGNVSWLWLESDRAADCWHEFRCAVHARVAADADRARAARPHDTP